METPEGQVLCEMISTCEKPQDDIIEIEVGLLKQDWAEACDATISQQNRLLTSLIERHYPFYAQHNATQKLADLLNTHLGTTLTGKNLSDRYRRTLHLAKDPSRTLEVEPVVFGYDIIWKDQPYHILVSKHEIVYGWYVTRSRFTNTTPSKNFIACNTALTRTEAIQAAVRAIQEYEKNANTASVSD